MNRGALYAPSRNFSTRMHCTEGDAIMIGTVRIQLSRQAIRVIFRLVWIACRCCSTRRL